MRRPFFVRYSALFAVLGIAGCQSAQQHGDLDGPIFGKSKPTTFIVSTDDVMHGRDLAKVARIIRRYKTLDEAERALVRDSVSKRLNGIIALEYKRVAEEPEYKAKREVIRKLPDRKEAARLTVVLDSEIQAEAARRIYKRLGGMVATAVTGPDNQSAVVFSRVGNEGVVVENSAYQIDRPVSALTDGSAIERDKATAATFVGGATVAVTAPNPAP